MEVRLIIQSTPNPNALKFVVNYPVKTQGNVTYKTEEDCEHNPLAEAIFKLDDNIDEVFFFDNYITVTQNGASDWDELEEKIREVVLAKMPDHNPDFQVDEKTEELPFEVASGPEIDQINAILDETVRPALQMDGGDIQVIDYANDIVKVFYQGACGSCPSASMGTMKAIENILKDQFNPAVTVELAETF